MIRKFFDWLEDWTMNDGNIFIGTAKLIFIIIFMISLVALPVAYVNSKQTKITLNESEWHCIHTRTIITHILVGKVIAPRKREICDVYEMNGEE
jgi:hypothetical protein